jgi:hypothetical protein
MQMRINRLLLFSVLLGVLTPVSALAQMIPPRVVSTVDVLVLSQDPVVIGRITAAKEGANRSTDVSIAVDEVLKGAVRESTLQRVQEPLRGARLSAEELSLLASGKARVLVIGDRFMPLDDGNLAVPTVAGALLRDANAVVSHIREVFRSHPGQNRVEAFQIPLPDQFKNVSPFFDNGMLNSWQQLAVPVDASLEKWGIETIQSGKEVYRGFQALRFFKSDQNISFVKGLLDDPRYELRRADDNNGIEVRQYDVRRFAYDTLKSWRIDVTEPLVSEEIPRFETLEKFDWQGTGGVTSEGLAERFAKAVALSKNLKVLILYSGSVLSQRQREMIGEIPSLTSLTMIGPNKTDEFLRSASKLTNLEELNVLGSGITDRGLTLLLSLPRLRTLNLSDTRITDAGLMTLAAIPGLKKISLAGTPVTPGGIAQIRAIRPDLEITR